MPIYSKEEKELLRDSAQMSWADQVEKKEHAVGKGTLILTNERLIFESITGFISKTTEMTEIGLSIIRDVRVEGLISKKLIIDLGPGLHQYYCKVSEPTGWATQIRAAVQSRG